MATATTATTTTTTTKIMVDDDDDDELYDDIDNYDPLHKKEDDDETMMKGNRDDDDDDDVMNHTQQPQQQQRPKLLSKWIQRLIHPELRNNKNNINNNEIVIQSPEIIPLNDTFILDFGRRIREDEVTFGITPIHIDHEIRDDDDDDHDDDDENDDDNKTKQNNDPSSLVEQQNDIIVTTSQPTTTTNQNNNNNNNKKLPRKVKITNIKYTTTATMMEQILEEQFGLIEYMNLIMQPTSAGDAKSNTTTKTNTTILNSGLAYVTFVEASAANQCAQELKVLDQRPVSVTLLTNTNNNNNHHHNNNTNNNNATNRRYWSEIDLSIQCYNCGQTGHRSYECTTTTTSSNSTNNNNQMDTTTITPRTGFVLGSGSGKQYQKPRRPCPLCANRIDHSEIYKCPYRNVCFNCGIPGHISRECIQQQQQQQQQQSNQKSSSSSSYSSSSQNNYNNNNNRNNNNNNSISRCVCTICYTINQHTKYTCPWLLRRNQSSSNHHRNYNSRNNNNNNNIPPPLQVHPIISTISSYAICISCGRQGHFLCHELKWFYGLNGVSCCNCGMPGHIYTQCSRPNLEICSRNEETLLMEIERAVTVRSVEQSIFDANTKQQPPPPPPPPPPQHRGANNNQQHRQNDTSNNNNRQYHRGSSSSGAAAAQGQSRYGSLDQSRSNNNNNSNNQSYERGRQMDRQQQPQFRPFKSMPPPPQRQQHSQSNNTHYYTSDQQNNNSHKRNRSGNNNKNNNNNNDSDSSSPQHKRRRPN